MNRTVNIPRLLNMFAIVVSCPKYSQRDRSGDKIDRVLFSNRSRISFSKNPDFIFFIPVVFVYAFNRLKERNSKSLPGFITLSAHDGNLSEWMEYKYFSRFIYRNSLKSHLSTCNLLLVPFQVYHVACLYHTKTWYFFQYSLPNIWEVVHIVWLMYFVRHNRTMHRNITRLVSRKNIILTFWWRMNWHRLPIQIFIPFLNTFRWEKSSQTCFCTR